MKKLLALTVVLFGVSLVVGVHPVFAQEAGPIEVGKLFSWATADPPDWGKGALLAALGLVGALVVVFGHIGGSVPGTAGSARIEAGLKRVEEREKALDKLINAPAKDAQQIEAVEIATNNLRDDVRDDRRRQFTIAALLYAVLGAFFGSLLAQDLLQAFVIGAGWTAYLGLLGLKNDYAERKSIKDATAERLEGMVSRLEQSAPLSDHEQREWDDLRMESQVARAL